MQKLTATSLPPPYNPHSSDRPGDAVQFNKVYPHGAVNRPRHCIPTVRIKPSSFYPHGAVNRPRHCIPTVRIKPSSFGGALDRLYYAAFYAARALLALHHADSSRHTGVISLFQQRFVKTEIVAEEVARVLPKAFAKRQISDYGDFTETTGDEVRALRADVERFISACEAALAELDT